MALRLSRAEAAALGIHAPARRSKFGSRKAVLDGITFDSQGERDRYAHLKLELFAGQIAKLRTHVRFSLDVNGQHVCSYVADFVYERDGQVVVEDFKGFETDVFRLKEKLMRAVHGITLLKPRARPARRGRGWRR